MTPTKQNSNGDHDVRDRTGPSSSFTSTRRTAAEHNHLRLTSLLVLNNARNNVARHHHAGQQVNYQHSFSSPRGRASMFPLNSAAIASQTAGQQGQPSDAMKRKRLADVIDSALEIISGDDEFF